MEQLSRRKLRRVYLDSYKNLLFLNEIYHKTESNEYKRILDEPGRFRGNRVLVDLVGLVFLFIYPFVITYQALKIDRKRRKHKKDCTFFNAEGYLLLCLNRVLKDLIKEKNIDDSNLIWLIEEDEEAVKVSGSISLWSLINHKDVIFSLVDASIVSYSGIKRYGFSVVFLGLKAFKWFIRYRACASLPMEKELFFCNHMDQNATLINNLPHHNKTLIQHGTALIIHNPYGLGKELLIKIPHDKYWVYNLPCKYETVTKVYTFSELEYIALTYAIFTNKPAPIIVGYGLRTYNLNNDKPTLLIVGYYTKTYQNEELIIKAFQDSDINIIVKNHPSQQPSFYNDMKSKYSFELLTERKFPKADVVISYDSTLALEYQSIGSKVLFYDDWDINDMIDYAKHLLSLY